MIFLDEPTARYVMNEREAAFRKAWQECAHSMRGGHPGNSTVDEAWYAYKNKCVKKESGS